MDLDNEICLCFHVTLRKLRSFLRVEQPRRASQLSECFGAGTGCGWCRPFLQDMFQQAQEGELSQDSLPTATEYGRQRSDYVRDGHGKPPAGATPIDMSPDDASGDELLDTDAS